MSYDAPAQQATLEDPTASDRHPAREDDRSRPSIFAVIGAELFGTFLLVFVGLGIALYATISGAGTLGVALGFGVALVAGMASVGHISGGHFNPAVTLGYAVAGRTAWKDLPVYWLAQIVGAVAAAATLFTTIPKSLASGDAAAYGSLKEFFSVTANGFGEHSPSFAAATSAFFKTYLDQGATQTQIDEAVTAGQLVVPTFAKFDAASVGIIEVVATALFVGVILAVTDERSRIRFTSVVVGLTFGLLLLLATPLSGGSLNPARSLAAALFSDGWALENVWIFWAAPLVGAIIAALFYRGFAMSEPVVEYVYRDDTLEEDDEDTTSAAQADDVVVTESVVTESAVTESAPVDEPAPTETASPEPVVAEPAAPASVEAPEPAAPASVEAPEPATVETVEPTAPPVKKAPAKRAPAKAAAAKAPAAKPAVARATPAKAPVARKAPAAKKAPAAPAVDVTEPTSSEPSTDAVDPGEGTTRPTA